MDKQLATFGAGCFWGVEAAFRRVVGRAEVFQVEFDPSKVSYEELLEVFWNCHNPTTLNRQGPDIGTQYRSPILVHDSAQEAIAMASKQEQNDSGRFPKPMATEITQTSEFFRAEERHQQYLEKRGLTSCATTSVEAAEDHRQTGESTQ